MSSLLTPVLLTFDEEPNLARTLESLHWAQHVVVLDSGSTDTTELIARSFANVAFFVRRFDCHRNQWAFAIEETGIETQYILALDADMAATPRFFEEFHNDFVPGDFVGGYIPIVWCYFGKPLVGSFCPPQLRLFRRDAVCIEQAGHTQEFRVKGRVFRFAHGVWHEDRKSIERWLTSQANYSRLESVRLLANRQLRPRDRVRRSGWMVPVAAVLSYFRAGGPFGGKRALRYALERATYESLLAIRLIDHGLDAEERKTRQPTPLTRP